MLGLSRLILALNVNAHRVLITKKNLLRNISSLDLSMNKFTSDGLLYLTDALRSGMAVMFQLFLF
jgi:hypothetical protein